MEVYEYLVYIVCISCTEYLFRSMIDMQMYVLYEYPIPVQYLSNIY